MLRHVSVFAVKCIAVAQELFLQLLEILDDPVVNAHYIRVLRFEGCRFKPTADMRMRIDLIGLSVSGPSGMTDPAGA